jgi:hypothetical protein
MYEQTLALAPRAAEFVEVRLEPDPLPGLAGHRLRVRVRVGGHEFGETRYLPADHAEGLLDRLLDEACAYLKRNVRRNTQRPPLLP